MSKVPNRNNVHYWDKLSQIIPGYATRPEQMKLHRAVLGGMITGKNVICEGPCGTGKSMAYLMAHLCVGWGRTVIVTATNSMVGQLFRKDLPMVEDCASLNMVDLDWTMIMGKTNYICPKRLNDWMRDGKFNSGDRLKAMGRYLSSLDRERKHWVGHIDKLEFYESIKSTMTIPSGMCRGSKCMDSPNCEMFTARHYGKTAGLVVTNYHIFIMDAIMKNMGIPAENTMLGHYDRVVMDEAHELPEIAREYFALELSDKWIEKICKRIEPVMRGQLRLSWRGYKQDFINAGAEGFIEKFPVRERVAALLKTVLEECHEEINYKETKKDDDYRALDEIAQKIELTEDALLGNVTNKTHAYGFFNKDGEGVVRCVELNTGNLLKRLYPEGAQVTAISATLSMHTSKGIEFGFMKRQLGLSDAEEVVVKSPFNFKCNVVQTLSDAPDPNSPEWVNYCALVLKTMITEIGGRTLGLFTSSSRMREIGEILNGDRDIKTRVMVQGDASNAALTEQFRSDPSTTLLGVNSFWTGIDISGPSLSAVFVERIPFPVPGDLVSSAMQASDRNAFMGHMVPYAIMQMKQGTGRLIRSESDFGLIVIPDSRIKTKAYGKRVLKNILPGAVRMHGDMEALRKRCEGLRKAIAKKA